jgi:carboxylesterase type B
MRFPALGLFLTAVRALPAPVPEPAAPLQERAAKVTVSLPSATVVGSSSGTVDTFNGIPFAKPPTGALRLKPPQKPDGNLGTVDATGTAAACPQMFFSTDSQNIVLDVLGNALALPLLQVVNGKEDCLTINVQRPAGTAAGAKLPVLFWIFGGGFELGSTNMYDGSSLVSAGVDLSKPFVFVAVNYRVGGFGFMPGKEILADGSSNLGLLDQRMGLEWVADNIAAFGGDPDKVTIWGESAGAISVFDQMALYGGDNKYKSKPLFRGAIMNSGSIVPVGPVDSPKGQAVYDKVVKEAGCGGKSDTLACLRGVDYETFLKAANSVPGILSYNTVALSYLPRPDGRVLPETPDALAAKGKYAAVPMIVGDQEDEGTLFALFTPNLTSTARVVSYLSSLFFPDATTAQLTTLVNTYPTSLTEGSPFRTGIFNELYPGFKRVAAILGDLVFTLTRRLFLATAKSVNPNVKSWSYLASYDYGTPILGTFHGSDILQVFFGILPGYTATGIRNYYFNFLYNLDPNVGGSVGSGQKYPTWPEWTVGGKLMSFENGKNALLDDTFRSDSYEFLAGNVGSLKV